MDLPKWLRGHLDLAGKRSVEAAIAAAEKKTSAELVVMIVHRSTAVAHVPLVATLLLLNIFFMVEAWNWQSDWLGHHRAWLIADIVAAVVFGQILGRIPWLQRFFTDSADMAHQVHSRAVTEFYQSGFQNTKNHSGVLLFISTLERQAVILTDSGISSQWGEVTWRQAVEKITAADNFALGLVAAISECGTILSQKLPVGSDDTDELSNGLLIKE